jgi:hypothetical protein
MFRILSGFSVIMPQKTAEPFFTANLIRIRRIPNTCLPLSNLSLKNSERAPVSHFLSSGPTQDSNLGNHRHINSLQTLVSLFLFRETTSKGRLAQE